MRNTPFYYLGRFICRFRWIIMILWIAALCACIPYLPHITDPFKTTGFIAEQSESAKAEKALNKTLGYDNNNRLIIMYNSKTLLATNPRYIKKIKKSLSGLSDFPVKHEIIFPDQNQRQISKDKHSAYVVVIIKQLEPINDQLLEKFKASIKKPSHMNMLFGGEPFFIESVDQQTQIDLYRADIIATPIAIITLLIVFGSIVAAIMPILLGGACAILILTLLYCLGHYFTLSIFTLNIALLLGLCLSLDYSLLIISRFRDELDKGKTISIAIATTQATAGKAVFFSAIAVIVSLSALLLFPINILFSIAVGGMTAVMIAMFTAMLILPALLAILKTNINRLPVNLFQNRKTNKHPIWRRLATAIVYRPRLYCCFILVILLILGYPFLSAKFGVSDFHIFPAQSDSRRFYDTYSEKFKETELTPIVMIVHSLSNPVLSSSSLYKIYRLTQKLKRNSMISRVDGITSTDPQLTVKQYDQLYHLPKHAMSPSVKQLLETTTRRYLTIINIISHYQNNSPETKTLIHELRSMSTSKSLRTQIIGSAVSNQDVLTIIANRLPVALIWIFVSTYIVMLILLRSLLLPLKAIIMNLLSLSACYGALVLVFQQGYLHQLLGFDPQGMLDISLIVIIELRFSF